MTEPSAVYPVLLKSRSYDDGGVEDYILEVFSDPDEAEAYARMYNSMLDQRDTRTSYDFMEAMVQYKRLDAVRSSDLRMVFWCEYIPGKGNDLLNSQIDTLEYFTSRAEFYRTAWNPHLMMEAIKHPQSVVSIVPRGGTTSYRASMSKRILQDAETYPEMAHDVTSEFYLPLHHQSS